MRATAFVSALLACLCPPTLSSPAAAAPFQQYQNAVCSEDSCFIAFAITPTGKRMEIDDVSCYLRMNGAHELTGMGLIVGAHEHLVVLAPEAAPGGNAARATAYAASHPIFAYAREGERFTAFAQWREGAAAQFACHISGEILDAPG